MVLGHRPLEPGGRVRLPAAALVAIGFSPGQRLDVWGACNRVALVVRPDGPGARAVVDVHGRLPLPVWLRRGPDRALLIGSDPAAPMLVIAPPACSTGSARSSAAACDERPTAPGQGADGGGLRAGHRPGPDLIAADATSAARIPTVAEFIATIELTFTKATAATYRPYWRLAVDRVGDRRLAEVTTEDLTLVTADAEARARRLRPASTGRASRETCVAALRALFAQASAAGLINGNPAAVLRKPRRGRSRRRALDDVELAELIAAVRTTSGDSDLDLLVVRFHLESGARRQGALSIRRVDLDPTRATVWLREKGDSEREQPVSPSLVALVQCHHGDRAPDDVDGQLFRTRDGRPMSARRYDTVFARARACLDWADRTPVSAHVLRHTAITAVGRLAGYPVAQAFAGHAPPSVTGRYLHATLAEVASAVMTLTGERHPLAHPNRVSSGSCRRG